MTEKLPETEHFFIEWHHWTENYWIGNKPSTRDSLASLPSECFTGSKDLAELHQRMIAGEEWYVANRRTVDAQRAVRAVQSMRIPQTAIQA